MTNEFVVGVDAGGTKTTAMVAALTGEVRSCRETGPGNPIRAGKQTAFANISSVIEQAIDEANVSPDKIGTAVVGMAGGGTESMRADAMRAIAGHVPIPSVLVVPDYQLVLPAAFPDGGVALIAGTGSIVHGVSGDRQTRVGGRGYLIDDDGSGYWIGRQALKAVARELDGRGPRTDLTNAVCRSQSTASPVDVLVDIQASPDRLTKIAEIAPIVVAMADTDRVASEIVQKCAAVLAEMVQAACKNIGLPPNDYPLAVAGSVLSKTPTVRDQLLARLTELDVPPSQVATVVEPVHGAVRLALQARS